MVESARIPQTERRVRTSVVPFVGVSRWELEPHMERWATPILVSLVAQSEAAGKPIVGPIEIDATFAPS